MAADQSKVDSCDVAVGIEEKNLVVIEEGAPNKEFRIDFNTF